MIHRRITTAIYFCLFLAACGDYVLGDETAARKAVLATLANPDSAMFGKFTLIGKNRACLTINAKDSAGEYFGDQQAYLARNADGWSVMMSYLSDHADCIEATRKMSGVAYDLRQAKEAGFW